jgi:hypothetical protein
VSIRFTGTAAAHTLGIYGASADNTTTTSGPADMFHAWGAQVELATDGLPSSYIATTTASATRTVDALVYVANDGNFSTASGMLSADLLHTAHDALGTHDVAAVGGTGANSVRLLTLAAGDIMRADVFSGGAVQMSTSGTTDVVDGEIHTVALTWTTNDGKLLVDGAQEGATDTSLTPPASAPTSIEVGGIGGLRQAHALIGNVRIRNATT